MGVNWGLGDFFAGFQVLVILVAGVFFVERGALTEGEFLAFTAYNFHAGVALREPGAAAGGAQQNLHQLHPPVRHPRRPGGAELPPPPVKPPWNGDIVFDHVNFGYSDSSEVLKDVSFTVKAGTTFGILGATGSGKSTLMYLLDRLYELPEGCGTITIGGVDIRRIDLAHLRSHIGIVLQEPFLFSKDFPGEHLGRRSPARRRRRCATSHGWLSSTTPSKTSPRGMILPSANGA